MQSGVICLPDNYGPNVTVAESKIRVTHPANFQKWEALSKDQYNGAKEDWEEKIMQNSMKYLEKGHDALDELNQKTTLMDTFTPTTIKHFTSHINGTLYGSPTKRRDGSTKYKNLFLAGTDQGYVGIVGAMLGGIAVANNQILRNG